MHGRSVALTQSREQFVLLHCRSKVTASCKSKPLYFMDEVEAFLKKNFYYYILLQFLRPVHIGRSKFIMPKWQTYFTRKKEKNTFISHTHAK